MFVEFHMESPMLRATFERVPDITVVLEELDATSSVPLRSITWVEGTDEEFDAFDAALDDDPSVADWSLLLDIDRRRLYRFTHPGDLPDVRLYQTAVQIDSFAQRVVREGTGWRLTLIFQDRESFETFRDHCEEVGISIRVHAVYSEYDSLSSPGSSLTKRQEETLVAALDAGYFSIPREMSLSELAEQLGISAQATSERLRRGIETLVEEALADS